MFSCLDLGVLAVNSPKTKTMNVQTNSSTILHRPSRRINRVAIAAASSRADMRNATASPSPLDSPRYRTDQSERYLLCPEIPSSSDAHSNKSSTVLSETSQLLPSLSRRSSKPLTVGSWNVRTMLDRPREDRPERRTALIAMELRRYNIDIAALSETRLADHGKLREAGTGYTFYWVGHPADAPREHGVCFAIADRINSLLVGEPVGVSPRLMTARLRLGRGKFASIISVYAPPMNHTEEEKTRFYAQLSSIIGSTPASDRIFLMGDFNARVGRECNIWPNVLGAHGIGKMNSNGELLLGLCATHALSITNTQFRLEERDIATWTHPRSGHQHLLDYVIVRQRDTNEIRITRAMRGAECSTDHMLVRTKVRIQVRRPLYFKAGKAQRKFNLHRFDDRNIRAFFQRIVSAHLKLSSTTTNAQTMWQNLKSTVLSAAEKTIGHKHAKRADWFDENNHLIKELVKLKNTAFGHLVDDPNNTWNKTIFLRSRSLLTQSLRSLKVE